MSASVALGSTGDDTRLAPHSYHVNVCRLSATGLPSSPVRLSNSMPAPQSAPSRIRSSEATRQALLAAARRHFLQESYESVGLREIAGDVGVDVALISRYFGSKEDLFREVLRAGRKDEILPSDISSEEIPAFMANLFVEQDADGREHVERLLVILRSASSPASSQIVRETLRKDILQPLAERLGGENPELRASTLMAVWMGMTIMRTVISIEPLSESGCEVDHRLERLFFAALCDSAPVA